MNESHLLTQAEGLELGFHSSQIAETQGAHYVAISEVTARLNVVLGVGRWGYSVNNVQTWGVVRCETGEWPTHVTAHVTVWGVIDGERAEVDGVGGQEVKFRRPKDGAELSPGPNNLGDEFKGAVSDAVKKAVQHWGVALELARREKLKNYRELDQRLRDRMAGTTKADEPEQQPQEQPEAGQPAAPTEAPQEAPQPPAPPTGRFDELGAALAKLGGAQVKAFRSWTREKGYPLDPTTLSDEQIAESTEKARELAGELAGAAH